MNIAIIGGGWAGIAAAVELSAAGVATTLFEAGRVLGGRGRSIEIDGRCLDNGQHILLGAYRDTLALMRQVGADPDALFERHPLQVTDATGFRLALPRLPAPLNLVWGLMTAQPVSLREKTATAVWMLRLQARRFRLSGDLNVAEWLDASRQTGILRRHLWEPLCLAALNTPAERASAQLFANVLRDSLGSPTRADTDLLLPRVPFGELLPEPAARWLTDRGTRIKTGCRIQRLETATDGTRVNGERFTATIVATAPQHARQLLPDSAFSCDFEPIATIYLQYPTPRQLAFPLQSMLGSRYGQWVVDRGQGLLACVLSGHGDWETLSDHALAADLAASLGLPEQPVWHRVIREKRATFSCRPGLARPGTLTAHPRVLRAGDYTWQDYPATLEGAIRSGKAAARQVLSAAAYSTW